MGSFNNPAGIDGFDQNLWDILIDSITIEETEGRFEVAETQQAIFNNALEQLYNSGLPESEKATALAGMLQRTKLSTDAVAQAFPSIPKSDIDQSMADNGYGPRGGPLIDDTDGGNTMPIDLNTIDPENYTPEQLDQVMAAINSGELSVDQVAGHYGIDPSVIQGNVDQINGVPAGGGGTGGGGGGINIPTDPTIPPPVNGGGGLVIPPANQPTAAGAIPANTTSSNAHTITQQSVPPAYLQPFLNESVNYSRGALGALGDTLSRPNALISPFNPNQLESQAAAANIARGAGGYLDQANNVLSEVADGSDIEQLFNRGQNLMENGAGRQQLGQFQTQNAGNQIGINALQGTAAGDNLYGGAGFNAAIDASMRRAMPQIASTFSRAGSGGLKSGLAQTAIEQAHADAFAGQYGQERSNQLNASNSLNSLALGNRGFQQDAASRLLGADQQAGNTQLQLANADRGRQVNAAQLLPQFGLMGSDILGSVGQQQQNQDTAQRQAGVDQYQKLMEYSFGNFNPTSLMGSSSSQPVYQNRGAGLLGGAITGAGFGQGIGDLFGNEKAGAAIGGIAGGLLGGGYF